MNKIIQLGNMFNGTSLFNNPQRGRIYGRGGCSPTLSTCSGGGLEPKVLIGGNTVQNSYRIRKLTPLECFRLMGFTDTDFLAAKVGDREKAKAMIGEFEPEHHYEMMCLAESKDESEMSNSQLYKQAGNSIVVDVLYNIYKELYKAMPYLFDDLRVGSYFSGIGAFESGLDRLYQDIQTEVD